jgi:spore coat protein CotH
MLKRILIAPLVVVALAALSPLVAQGDPAAPLFDDSVLHEIRLTVNSKDWASLKEHFQDNTYYPADLRWRDQVVRNIGIRSRGTGSRRPNKPGLRIDFNRYTTGQTFLDLKSILLRNNSQDATNLRERLAMLFFRRLGIVAEREAHTRLYVNNEYLGLFTIVESPDKDFLQKNLGENDGHLYEFAFDNEAVLAGAAPFVFQYLGSNPALYTPSPFKPETLESDPQGDVLARFVQAINDTSSAAWRSNVSAYLDLPRFIRHLAVENFMAEEDGLTGDYGPNNFYLYRYVNTTKFLFLPWDKSNAFWDANFSIFHNINDGPEDHRNRLVVRALQEADLLQLYLGTMIECADSAGAIDAGQTQPWLAGEIQREYDQVHQAALDDTLLFTNAEFEAAITDLKAFPANRITTVRAQVAAAQAGH